MKEFMIGLDGALVGSLITVLGMVLIYKYESKKSDLKKTQLMNDIKSIYSEKLNRTQDNVKSFTGKMN